jgi:hypothetical protein
MRVLISGAGIAGATLAYLIGDAASCVSLLAGQGSALASLAIRLFVPFLPAKQKATLRFAGFFALKSKAALFIRNQVIKLLRIPWIAGFTIAGEITDRLTLPQY